VEDDEPLELGDELRVDTDSKLRLEPAFDGFESARLELDDHRLGRRAHQCVDEGEAAPHAERRAQRLGPLGGREVTGRDDASLETIDVERTLDDDHAVSVRNRFDRLSSEQPSEARDVVLERRSRGRAWVGTPYVFEQVVRRDDAVRIEEEKAEERTLLGRPQWDELSVSPDLQRSKDPVLDRDERLLWGGERSTVASFARRAVGDSLAESLTLSLGRCRT
jgi:hypothetical protein